MAMRKAKKKNKRLRRRLVSLKPSAVERRAPLGSVSLAENNFYEAHNIFGGSGCLDRGFIGDSRTEVMC